MAYNFRQNQFICCIVIFSFSFIARNYFGYHRQFIFTYICYSCSVESAISIRGKAPPKIFDTDSCSILDGSKRND